MITLKGIDWNDLDFNYQKTDTSRFLVSGKELMMGNIYIQTLGKSTKCWWCNVMLSSVYFLPLKYIYKLDKFHGEGSFCSLSCAKAYALDSLPKNREMYSKSLSLLEFLHRREGGLEKFIIPSPHWKLLKDYGGNLSLHQYKKVIGNYTYDMNPSLRYKNHDPVSCYFKEIS